MYIYYISYEGNLFRIIQNLSKLRTLLIAYCIYFQDFVDEQILCWYDIVGKWQWKCLAKIVTDKFFISIWG